MIISPKKYLSKDEIENFARLKEICKGKNVRIRLHLNNGEICIGYHFSDNVTKRLPRKILQ
ncbi:MAG: hypothetical protein WCT18_03605 [Patescibacteria group bacterium]